MNKISKQQCEILRQRAKNKFDRVRGTWCDLLRWCSPERASWILSQTPGERQNQHIVDPTHLFAHRSCVAGFSEGNTSTSRPWARITSKNTETSGNDEDKAWLQHYTGRVMNYLSTSNFYNAAGIFYGDYHIVNTGAHYMEELMTGGFFVHTFLPGSYFVLNDSYGEANVFIREFSLNVKAIVDRYAKKKKDGSPDWSNISSRVKRMYEQSVYDEMVDLVQVIMPNPEYDIRNPDGPYNRFWVDLTYEIGAAGRGTGNYADGSAFEPFTSDKDMDVFLEHKSTKRKPFIVGKSTDDFEYGLKGASSDILGLIKSLNKKAIGKDEALEKMLAPALQGPANLKKSYISQAANTYVPLDSKSMNAKMKLESIYNIDGRGIAPLIGDVADLRNMVEKAYYADFLLYLSRNPKTRTATETAAIVDEQNRVVGPALQALNRTYNVPVLEWVMDYVLFEDPYLKPPPESLEGQALNPELVSIFAQAQKAADLPAMDRYAAMVMNVGQIDPRILEKFDVDKYADMYEDRLYLPSGLNRPQAKVDAMREQAQMQQQRTQMLQETLPAVAGAAKDISSLQQ